jgi:hypothetical protein
VPTILEIEDGNPWWLSPDIWVVPGNDPNGAPGQPTAGEPAFLWARVHNKGEQSATGSRVNYYWSNPAAGVLRSNSTAVGFAFVDLDAGETKDVLCIIPWVPVVVNDGHECVVAEVIHTSDPLPSPLPDPFDPPTYRQVAQKNLTVLVMKKRMARILPIQISAPKRAARELLITAEPGGRLDDRLLAQVGLKEFQRVDGGLNFGLSLDASCDTATDVPTEQSIRVALKPGTARPVYLRVAAADLPPRSYMLLHVVSRSEQRIEGGISYVVVPGEEA